MTKPSNRRLLCLLRNRPSVFLHFFPCLRTFEFVTVPAMSFSDAVVALDKLLIAKSLRRVTTYHFLYILAALLEGL